MDIEGVKAYASLLDNVRFDHAKASELHASALRADPGYAQVLFEDAITRGGDALEANMRVLRAHDPGHVGAAWYLGRARAAKNDLEGAGRWYAVAVEGDASYADQLVDVARELEGRQEWAASRYGPRPLDNRDPKPRARSSRP